MRFFANAAHDLAALPRVTLHNEPRTETGEPTTLPIAKQTAWGSSSVNPVSWQN